MSNVMKSLLFLGLLAVSPVFAAGEQSSADGRQVVENVCNRCHTHARICLNLGRDTGWWTKTTHRMIRNGAPIDTAQADAAAAFLATLQPGSEPVCK